MSAASMSGLVDLHVHTAPDMDRRYGDDLKVAAEYDAAGATAILLKSHIEPTASRALIASSTVTRLSVYGGVVLNESVGGINPSAVEVAVNMDARCVWMPTRSAFHHRGDGISGISVVNDLGQVRPEAHEVLEIVAERGIMAATGHVSPAESVAIAEAATSKGVDKLLITHPAGPPVLMDDSTQRHLVNQGAVLECCLNDALKSGPEGFKAIVVTVRSFGAENVVVSGDFGQWKNGSPVEAFQRCIGRLLEAGLTEGEIAVVASTTPRRLLGIDGREL